MKRKLLEALEYPRLAALQSVIAGGCHRNGYFSPADAHCRICPLEDTCRWLNAQNDFIALAGRSVTELAGLLSEAVDHLGAHRDALGHNAVACCCTPCQWLRESRRLLRQAGLAITRGAARQT